MRTHPIHGVALGLLIAVATAARAQLPAPPEGVVSLASSASIEVAKDLLSVALSVTRDGPDAGTAHA